MTFKYSDDNTQHIDQPYFKVQDMIDYLSNLDPDAPLYADVAAMGGDVVYNAPVVGIGTLHLPRGVKAGVIVVPDIAAAAYLDRAHPDPFFEEDDAPDIGAPSTDDENGTTEFKLGS